MPESKPFFSPALVFNIKTAEGLSLTAYLDSVGVPTIGYGHTPCKMGDTCSQSDADAWLEADMARAYKAAASLPEARGIDPIRLEALTELCFNLGPARWALFTHCRAAVADRDWETAREELLDSKWAKQVGPTRSTRIANLLFNGHY